MSDTRMNPTPHARAARFPGPGRTAVLLTLCALVLVASVFAADHLAHRRTQRERREATDQTLVLAARALAGAAAPLVQADRLADLRALAATTARELGLARCTVALPDATVVVDTGAPAAAAASLPDSWTGDAGVIGAVSTESTPDATATASIWVNVSARGPIQVRVSARTPVVARTPRDLADTAAVGLAGLVLVLAGARWAAPQLRVLERVRGALESFAAGEASPMALRVADGYSGCAYAAAWNTIMAERLGVLASRTAARTGEALAARASGAAILERACDAMAAGVLVVGPDRRIVYANGAAAVLLRATRQELSSSPIEAHVPFPPVLDGLAPILAGTSRRRGGIEVQSQTAEQTSTLRFSLARLTHDGAESALVLVEDVTQQRLADQSRDAFVAQATHELRTPLTNIRLYVETALEEGENDPKVRAQALNVINQEARRLERIVADMLSVAEIEAGSLKLARDDVRLDALFDEIRHDYAAQAKEKNITLAFDLPPKFPVIHADRDKIAMAIHNLVANALKYTPTGGNVVVRVEADAKDVRVSVQDNGIGIDPKESERVFERFYRSTDARVEKIKGTGLGLAIAREVIRLHGGDITVQSQLNRGSTFVLNVPCTAEAA